jgi:hypothetical protein
LKGKWRPPGLGMCGRSLEARPGERERTRRLGPPSKGQGGESDSLPKEAACHAPEYMKRSGKGQLACFRGSLVTLSSEEMRAISAQTHSGKECRDIAGLPQHPAFRRGCSGLPVRDFTLSFWAFVVVLASLVLQGSTIAPAARMSAGS